MNKELTQEQFEAVLYQLSSIDDFTDDTKEWDGEMYVTGEGGKGYEIVDRLTLHQQIEIIENFMGNFPEAIKYFDFKSEMV